MKILLLLTLLAGTLSAADIYVDASSGNNSNAGTIGAPKLTLDNAINAASANDTIHLRAGTYVGDVKIDVNGLTVQSYTGEWAVVSVGTTNSSDSQCIWITAANVTLQDLEIEGGYNYCIKIEGTNGHIIQDCKVHGSGRDCFKLVPHSDNITIRRCEIYDSGQRDNSNAEGIDNVNSDNMHVYDCYFHDIATSGVYAKGGAVDCVIERNLIIGCGAGGIFLGFTTDSVWMNNAGFDNNPLYYENINGTVRNNIVVNTVYAGIGMSSALNPKIYNNTLINVATSGMSALHFHPRDGDNDLNPPCTGVDIRNNLVYMNGSRPVMNVRTGVNSSSVTYNTLNTATFTMDYNYYYRVGGSITFRNDQTSSGNINFSAWMAAMGTDANSVEGNPGVNTSTYHLNGGSPCIDGGVTLSHTDDFDDNTRAGSYDIGADETSGTALTTPPTAGTIGTGGGGTGPGPSAPTAPSGFSALAQAGVQVALSWTDTSSNEDGFYIERRLTGGSWAQVNSLSANTTSWTDSALVEGTSYEWRAQAYNATGNSAFSNSASATAEQNPSVGGSGSGDSGGGCSVGATNSSIWLVAIIVGISLLYRRLKPAR